MINEIAIGLLLTCSSFSIESDMDFLISVGDRLRIISQNNTEIVIVEKVTDENLVCHLEDKLISRQLSWRDLSKIEKEIPNSRVAGMGRGMVGGSGVGFVVGFIFGVIVGATDKGCTGDGTEICIDLYPVPAGFLAGLALGAVGMLVGGSIGAIHPGNRWQTIEPKLSAALNINQDNTLVFEVSVPF